MQGLWSRASPAQSARSVGNASSGLTTRGATGTSRRRLRIANSVTALYSSIFFAATIADARAKDKRRADLEEKIAAVKQDVSDLADEERRILEYLSTRGSRLMKPNVNRPMSRRLPSFRPRPIRHYSTTASLTAEKGVFSKNNSLDRMDEEPEDDSILQYSAADLENELHREPLDPEDADPIPRWAQDNILRLQAIQMLAVKQLAIRLLLHHTVAHNYEGANMYYAADKSVPQLRAWRLLKELNRLRHKIRELKEAEGVDELDLARDLPMSKVSEAKRQCSLLDDELAQNMTHCQHNNMSLEELLLLVSDNLMNSPIPDRIRAFKCMISKFTKMGHYGLVRLVLKTILPHYFELRYPAINAIINFYRRSQDLKGFDLFLKQLRGEGYPVKLRTLPFKLKRVNGVDVTVPPIDYNNTEMYSNLITTALRFGQPDRADAWLIAARKVGFVDNFATIISYLNFYAQRSDWEKGVNVLRRAIAFIAADPGNQAARVERTIMLMIELCDASHKPHVSEALISAYVKSGFPKQFPTARESLSPGMDHRFERYYDALGESSAQSLPFAEQCYTFVNIIGSQLEGLLKPPKYPKRENNRRKQWSRRLLSNSVAGLPSNAQGPNSISTGTKETAPSTENNQANELSALKKEMESLKAIVLRLGQRNDDVSAQYNILLDQNTQRSQSVK